MGVCGHSKKRFIHVLLPYSLAGSDEHGVDEYPASPGVKKRYDLGPRHRPVFAPNEHVEVLYVAHDPFHRIQRRPIPVDPRLPVIERLSVIPSAVQDSIACKPFDRATGEPKGRRIEVAGRTGFLITAAVPAASPKFLIIRPRASSCSQACRPGFSIGFSIRSIGKRCSFVDDIFKLQNSPGDWETLQKLRNLRPRDFPSAGGEAGANSYCSPMTIRNGLPTSGAA